MKRFIFFAVAVFVQAFAPFLYSESVNDIPQEKYVGDDEGYNEIDDEFYDSDEEDTPLAEMDPIYQDEDLTYNED